jgi:hypothetical protein
LALLSHASWKTLCDGRAFFIARSVLKIHTAYGRFLRKCRIGGIVLYFIISAVVKAPGYSLQQKFVGLGSLTGKTKAEIIRVVGPPSSFSSLSGGKTILQWMATGYHISLIFNGELCEGVSHEFAAR